MNSKFLLFFNGFDRRIPIIYITSLPLAAPMPKIIDTRIILYIFIPIIDNTGIDNKVKGAPNKGKEFNINDSKNIYNI